MRYFTKELLLKISSEDKRLRTQAEEDWKRNDAAYSQHFAKIRKYLPRRFLEDYFERGGFHDYMICGINIFRNKRTYSCELGLSDGTSTAFLLMEGIASLHVNFDMHIGDELRWLYGEFDITEDKNIKLSILYEPLNELQFEFKKIKCLEA